MKTLIERFKAETPLFFKRLQLLAASVSGAALAASVYYSSLPEGFKAAIPPQLIKYVVIAGVVATLVAQFTKK
jgi:hypothetical protein